MSNHYPNLQNPEYPQQSSLQSPPPMRDYRQPGDEQQQYYQSPPPVVVDSGSTQPSTNQRTCRFAQCKCKWRELPREDRRAIISLTVNTIVGLIFCILVGGFFLAIPLFTPKLALAWIGFLLLKMKGDKREFVSGYYHGLATINVAYTILLLIVFGGLISGFLGFFLTMFEVIGLVVTLKAHRAFRNRAQSIESYNAPEQQQQEEDVFNTEHTQSYSMPQQSTTNDDARAPEPSPQTYQQKVPQPYYQQQSMYPSPENNVDRHQPQPQQQPQRQHSPYEVQMQLLDDMGFHDQKRNEELLRQHNGQIQAVVSVLMNTSA